MNPAEQRFLQNRQTRWSSSSTTLSTTTTLVSLDGHHPLETTYTTTTNTTTTSSSSSSSLGKFWSTIRFYLSEWNQRLQHPSLTRQECWTLQEELRSVRQACLNPTTTMTPVPTTTTVTTTTSAIDSSTTNSPPSYNNDYIQVLNVIPADLPAADWRILHTEFTKCVQEWEDLVSKRFPKGKFTFLRYRKEVARRQALGIPLEEERPRRQEQTTDQQQQEGESSTKKEVTTTSPFNYSTTTTSSSPPMTEIVDETSGVQNVSHVSIHIQEDGTVWIRPRRKDKNDEDYDSDDDSSNNQGYHHHHHQSVLLQSKILVGSILLRKISHSIIQMYGSFILWIVFFSLLLSFVIGV